MAPLYAAAAPRKSNAMVWRAASLRSGIFPSLRRQYLGDFTLGMTDPLIQPTEIRLD